MEPYRGTVEPLPGSPKACIAIAWGAGLGGRLFYGTRGDVLAKSTVLRIWQKARELVLSAEDYSSPLARRPYDLRHACLSTWLNAGVSPKQVAEWAGNSVEVLHRTYEKCLVGHDEIAMRRISDVLRPGARESNGKYQPDTTGHPHLIQNTKKPRSP